MTADGEQTGQDAERTNTRAKSLEGFIKGLVQDAEGMRKITFLLLFFPYRKIKERILWGCYSPCRDVSFLNSSLRFKEYFG